MCLFVYIMVYSSNSNCIAAHVVDTHTSARAWEGKDTNKDVGEQRTYGLGQVHTKIHFLDMNMVQENTHFFFLVWNPQDSAPITSGTHTEGVCLRGEFH